jgi:hypothetical protein
MRVLLLACAAIALQGCVAKAVVGVVTLPVRAVGAGVDAVTTSQSEADEKRGREIRKREERLGELDRAYARQMERCRDGNAEACDKAAAIDAESKALIRDEPDDD